MNSKLVTCIGCKTQLKVRANIGEAPIKCPKCGQQFVLRAPATNQPARVPAPQPPPSSAAPSDLFPAQAQSAPSFSSASPPAPRPSGRRPKKQARGSTANKLLLIFGGVAFVFAMMCGGVVLLVASGALSPKHRGWETVQYQGYRIKMPPGEGMRFENSAMNNGLANNELTGVRAESGSQYMLSVMELRPSPARTRNLETVLIASGTVLSERKKIQRHGIEGVSGKIDFMDGGGLVRGTEVEAFLHADRLIVTSYSPYSLIKDRIGETDKVRPNERELDIPQEFFESIMFR